MTSVLDRFLFKEILKFTLLALLCVVAIYLLIDVFEQIDYFANYHVGLNLVFLYYLHLLPEAVNLLLPASLLLAIFMVYGRMGRSGELTAIKSSGIDLFRIFGPGLIIGFLSIFFLFLSKDFLEIPWKRRLRRFQRERIERRSISREERRREVYFIGAGNYIYYVKELERIGVMRKFSISQLNESLRVVKRYDGEMAFWDGRDWQGVDVFIRTFKAEGEELKREDTFLLYFVKEKPEEFFRDIESPEEMQIGELATFIKKMRSIGYKVDNEVVEYNLRFAQAFIGFVVLLLGLPLAVKLRRVTLGLGLGLLFSFLFWGLIQIFKALGEVRILPPFVAAFLPNFLFALLGIFFFFHVEK